MNGSVWLRTADLLVGPRVDTGDAHRAALHAALLAGPTVVDQRLREVAFTEAFTPDPWREWKATVALDGWGVRLRLRFGG